MSNKVIFLCFIHRDYVNLLKEETDVAEESRDVRSKLIVDERIAEVEMSDVEENVADVTGVSDDVTNVSDDVTGVSNDVTGVSDDVTGVSDDVTDVSDDVTGVSDENRLECFAFLIWIYSKFLKMTFIYKFALNVSNFE